MTSSDSRSKPWREYLAISHTSCGFCPADDAVRVDSGVLPPDTDIETYGRRRYFAALRVSFAAHVAAAHPDKMHLID
jgi:hypothetical protein